MNSGHSLVVALYVCGVCVRGVCGVCVCVCVCRVCVCVCRVCVCVRMYHIRVWCVCAWRVWCVCVCVCVVCVCVCVCGVPWFEVRVVGAAGPVEWAGTVGGAVQGWRWEPSQVW